MKAMNRYRCDVCGCYLDPGEGLLCEECRDDMKRRIKRAEDMSASMYEGADGQYEMRLQEVG